MGDFDWWRYFELSTCFRNTGKMTSQTKNFFHIHVMAKSEWHHYLLFSCFFTLFTDFSFCPSNVTKEHCLRSGICFLEDRLDALRTLQFIVTFTKNNREVRKNIYLLGDFPDFNCSATHWVLVRFVFTFYYIYTFIYSFLLFNTNNSTKRSQRFWRPEELLADARNGNRKFDPRSIKKPPR